MYIADSLGSTTGSSCAVDIALAATESLKEAQQIAFATSLSKNRVDAIGQPTALVPSGGTGWDACVDGPGVVATHHKAYGCAMVIA